jgi:hypothetical protein
MKSMVTDPFLKRCASILKLSEYDPDLVMTQVENALTQVAEQRSAVVDAACPPAASMKESDTHNPVKQTAVTILAFAETIRRLGTFEGHLRCVALDDPGRLVAAMRSGLVPSGASVNGYGDPNTSSAMELTRIAGSILHMQRVMDILEARMDAEATTRWVICEKTIRNPKGVPLDPLDRGVAVAYRLDHVQDLFRMVSAWRHRSAFGNKARTFACWRIENGTITEEDRVTAPESVNLAP